MAYQLIQLEHQATDSIQCPHCGHWVINWQEEQYVQPCEHTLFIAMDIGFEYITDEFEATMAHSVDELHANDDQMNMFDAIKAANYPQFLVLQADLGLQGYSRYLGFSV